MAGTYAAEMADRGYAALAFDFRGWGQSQGTIKYLEDPARKTEDINAAVNFLTTLAEVDSTRIAGLGVCASAGYMSDAALQNASLSRHAQSLMPFLKTVVEEKDHRSKQEIGRLSICLKYSLSMYTEP